MNLSTLPTFNTKMHDIPLGMMKLNPIKKIICKINYINNFETLSKTERD
jgi:hypothetical protein